ncbi:MAG: DNA-binding protein [Candidatus Micrarchaeota archaeon]
MEEDEERKENEEFMLNRRKQQEDLMKRQQQDTQIRQFLRSSTDDAAYNRLMNIKQTNSEWFSQLFSLISIATQRGIKKVTEEMLVKWIGELRLRKKEPTIKFLRK